MEEVRGKESENVVGEADGYMPVDVSWAHFSHATCAVHEAACKIQDKAVWLVLVGVMADENHDLVCCRQS